MLTVQERENLKVGNKIFVVILGQKIIKNAIVVHICNEYITLDTEVFGSTVFYPDQENALYLNELDAHRAMVDYMMNDRAWHILSLKTTDEYIRSLETKILLLTGKEHAKTN